MATRDSARPQFITRRQMKENPPVIAAAPYVNDAGIGPGRPSEEEQKSGQAAREHKSLANNARGQATMVFKTPSRLPFLAGGDRKDVHKLLYPHYANPSSKVRERMLDMELSHAIAMSDVRRAIGSFAVAPHTHGSHSPPPPPRSRRRGAK